MDMFPHVSAGKADELRELARAVKAALIAHGINVVEPSGAPLWGGAKIEVDTGFDAAGGVYVSWRLSPELGTDVSHHLMEGDREHEIVKQAGRIRRAMQESLIAILLSAGYNARAAEDDMRPLSVKVSINLQFRARCLAGW